MSTTKSAAYKAAGVDLDAGEVFGSFCGEICRTSYKNSKHVKVTDWSRGHFRGPRAHEFKNLPRNIKTVAGCDGIGTKTIIIAAADKMESTSANLLAMLAGDITRWGGLPLILYNNLEVKTLGKVNDKIFRRYQTMMRGLGELLQQQGYVGFTGETAQMSVCVSSEDPEAKIAFNWSGAMIGVNSSTKLINGSRIRPGMVIMALRDGLRSNGASQIRKYFQQEYGKKWWSNSLAAEEVAEAAQPAELYDTFLTQLNGWHNPDFRVELPVYGIAHLSGGGIPSKFGDGLLFPTGHSAVLEDPWSPPNVVNWCVSHLKIKDKEAYSTFNGGQGALVVIKERDVFSFIDRALLFGIASRPAGYICETAPGRPPHIMIGSRFTGDCFKVEAKG